MREVSGRAAIQGLRCGNDILQDWYLREEIDDRITMDLTLEEIRARLTAAKDDLYRRYPIRSLSIFGSFARNEAGPESDIDILVDFSEPIGFEVADLAFELEELLGHPVDLVSRAAIRERLRPQVEKDLVNV